MKCSARLVLSKSLQRFVSVLPTVSGGTVRIIDFWIHLYFDIWSRIERWTRKHSYHQVSGPSVPTAGTMHIIIGFHILLAPVPLMVWSIRCHSCQCFDLGCIYVICKLEHLLCDTKRKFVQNLKRGDKMSWWCYLCQMRWFDSALALSSLGRSSFVFMWDAFLSNCAPPCFQKNLLFRKEATFFSS